MKIAFLRPNLGGQRSNDAIEPLGFARAITDYTTNYYICDVIVDEEYRGEGIGKKLVETLTNDEDLVHVRGLLITKDAKKFYEKFGFYNKEDVMQKDKK